jgi:hypothetical protein
MNNDLKNIARKVLGETRIPENEKFGSIIALLMVISICITAIRVVQECNKRNQRSDSEDIYTDIKDFCHQRTLAKWRLRKEMRKAMSREQYKKYRCELESAILNVGNQISLSETNALLEATND